MMEAVKSYKKREFKALHAEFDFVEKNGQVTGCFTLTARTSRWTNRLKTGGLTNTLTHVLTEPHSSPLEHYEMTISLHLTMPCTCTLFVLMLWVFTHLKNPTKPLSFPMPSK